MIITDIVITMSGRGNQSDPCSNRVSIQTGAGNVAEFMLVSDTFMGITTYVQQHSFSQLPQRDSNRAK